MPTTKTAKPASNKASAAKAPTAIKGAPTDETKVKARATAKGPKQGAARASQSAQYENPDEITGKAPAAPKASKPAKAPAKAKPAPKDPDTITKAEYEKATTDLGNKAGIDLNNLVVRTATATVKIPSSKVTKSLAKLAVIGGSLQRVREYLAETAPQLARGLSSRDAPQASAAIMDAKRKGKPAPAATPTDKPAKAPTARAPRAPKASKASASQKITIVDKAFTFGGEGTARRASWDACKRSATVGEYLAAKGAAKYLPRWQAAGAIRID